MDTNIIVAIITLIGTIAVAVISNLDKFTASGSTPATPAATIPTEMMMAPTAVVFTPTILPTVAPTDAVPVGEPTSTALPPTEPPTATPSPVSLGEDWPQDCNSALWQPYPLYQTVPLGNGCLQQPIYFFETGNGLNFQDDGRDASSPVYGLFAPVPGTAGTVTIKVSLNELSKADLLMGVYQQQDLNSKGLLMAIPAGDVKKQKILQMLSYNNYDTVDNTTPTDQRDGYTITDTLCPLGPWIDTRLDPSDALVTCHINSQLRQMASTRDMVFPVAQLVAYISSVMTLEPGDVILTGTPSGVGPLEAGDEVRVEIEGLGTLTNPVRNDPHREVPTP